MTSAAVKQLRKAINQNEIPLEDAFESILQATDINAPDVQEQIRNIAQLIADYVEEHKLDEGSQSVKKSHEIDNVNAQLVATSKDKTGQQRHTLKLYPIGTKPSRTTAASISVTSDELENANLDGQPSANVVNALMMVLKNLFEAEEAESISKFAKVVGYPDSITGLENALADYKSRQDTQANITGAIGIEGWTSLKKWYSEHAGLPSTDEDVTNLFG